MNQILSIEKLIITKEMDAALQKFKLRPQKNDRFESITGNMENMIGQLDIEKGSNNMRKFDTSLIKGDFSFDDESSIVKSRQKNFKNISEKYLSKLSLRTSKEDNKIFKTAQNNHDNRS